MSSVKKYSSMYQCSHVFSPWSSLLIQYITVMNFLVFNQSYISGHFVLVEFFFLIFVYLFIYLALLGLSCGMWGLVLCPGIEPRPPALGVQSLSHLTIREVPKIFSYCFE